ncbi:hypothetical protein M8J76_015995 [Diaphorina citri]|nr:hypothetical protein M8J76_015995 [Diaphorina citri]
MDGGRAGTSLTPELGERVIWCGLSPGRGATVKWTGILPEISREEITLGLAFDSALEFGGGEGKWKGQSLFSCDPRHGLFVPASSVIPESCLTPNITKSCLTPNITNHATNTTSIESSSTTEQHFAPSPFVTSSSNPKTFFELLSFFVKTLASGFV